MLHHKSVLSKKIYNQYGYAELSTLKQLLNDSTTELLVFVCAK